MKRFVDWWLRRRGAIAIPVHELADIRAKAQFEVDRINRKVSVAREYRDIFRQYVYAMLTLLRRCLEELEYVKANGNPKPNPPGCDGMPEIDYIIHDVKEALQ